MPSRKSFSEKLASRQPLVDNDENDETEMNPLAQQLLRTLAGMDNDIKPRNGIVSIPQNAIVATEDGALEYRSFRLTRIGLQTSNGSYEDWMQLGVFLHQMQGSLQWLIGDWINQGETVYGQTYEQIASMMGFEKTTLYDYAYVARRIDFSIRIENLSFGHHQIVVALEPDQQRYWLEQAAVGEWSIAKLRQAIKDQMGGETPKRDQFDSFATRWLQQADKLSADELEIRISQLRELLKQSEKILRSKR